MPAWSPPPSSATSPSAPRTSVCRAPPCPNSSPPRSRRSAGPAPVDSDRCALRRPDATVGPRRRPCAGADGAAARRTDRDARRGRCGRRAGLGRRRGAGAGADARGRRTRAGSVDRPRRPAHRARCLRGDRRGRAGARDLGRAAYAIGGDGCLGARCRRPRSAPRRPCPGGSPHLGPAPSDSRGGEHAVCGAAKPHVLPHSTVWGDAADRDATDGHCRRHRHRAGRGPTGGAPRLAPGSLPHSSVAADREVDDPACAGRLPRARQGDGPGGRWRGSRETRASGVGASPRVDPAMGELDDRHRSGPRRGAPHLAATRRRHARSRGSRPGPARDPRAGAVGGCRPAPPLRGEMRRLAIVRRSSTAPTSCSRDEPTVGQDRHTWPPSSDCRCLSRAGGRSSPPHTTRP